MMPFMKKKTQDDQLVVNGTLNPQGNARAKVENDIAFLRERIAAMQSQLQPNKLLIEHYQSMLRSRESVLKWLMDGCDDETTN
jgi:hypothetical protein